MDVAAWLRELGLEQYEAAFRANDIGPDLLPGLTADDLKELGVGSLGHRKRLLEAIAALRPGRVTPQAPAMASAEPVGAERRQLTVLFCDLAGSTALSARLDPEDLREVMAAYHVAVADAVRRQGGYLAKYLGDGVLAYFGWPLAHEDDAERAARAGLEACTAVARLETYAGPLAARVGIATGPVVVGDLLGEGDARERGVVGETPNLAARLQALAEPGAVVMDDATRRLTGVLFDCADLGEAELKGVPRPVHAWRVLGVGEIESRFEALRGGTAAAVPLVGRREELELLLRRWRQACAGEGQVVFLSGEPGIGKSRLVAALLGDSSVADIQHERADWFCAPQHQDSTLQPVIARVERSAGFRPDDPPDVRSAKLERFMALTAASPEDMAAVADLLSIPTGGRWPEHSRLAPQARRARLLEAILRRVAALACRAPLLAVFEDVHWADPTTRELLDLLVEQVPRSPMLLVVTHRPEFRTAFAGQPHVTTLALGRLAQRDGTALVERMAGAAGLSREAIAEIVERTDGVPLFLEELTKAVVEAGAERTLGAVAPVPLGVPATLHAPLLARLDRLGTAALAVTQAGAAIGREFGYGTVAAVARLPETEFAGALEQLEGADLVRRRGTPPDAVYVFKHALIQDVAYGTLLRRQRQELHARVAGALEDQYPGLAEIQPELLAYHHTRAAMHDTAADLWLRAGRRSAEASANQEAVRQLRQGLEVLATLPPSPERDRRELAFQLAIATPLVALRGYAESEVKAAYDRAGELCERPGDPEQVVFTLFGWTISSIVRGDMPAARGLGERCAKLVGERGDPVFRLLKHRAVGAVHTLSGEFPKARAELEQLLALRDLTRDHPLSARCLTDPFASGLTLLSLVECVMGLPGQARRTARRALDEAQRLKHVATSGFVGFFAGAQLAELLGDVAGARRHADAVLAAALEHRMPTWRGHSQILIGWAMAREGRVGEGLGVLREGIEVLATNGTAFHHAHYMTLQAELRAQGGDVDAALRIIKDALGHAERTGEHFWLAEVYRVQGRLLLQTGGSTDEAEACFARALGVARGQESRLFELRAATDLAQLRRKQGRPAEARRLLAPVYASFAEGHGMHDLAEAKALIEDLARAGGDAVTDRSDAG